MRPARRPRASAADAPLRDILGSHAGSRRKQETTETTPKWNRSSPTEIELGDERAVDLDLVERERVQVDSEEWPSAKIVHRDAHAAWAAT
jgi:hypothetical protein